MIGDPIIVSENDYSRARVVMPEISSSEIILIGGGSGTSKSELAYCIQKLLFDKKKSSLVISLDDYYLVHPSVRAINRKKQGIDSVGSAEIDWESLKRIYEDFSNERLIHFKRTHRFMDNIEHGTINSEDVDYLIVEGLYANYFRKYYQDNFSIFLEGNPAQTLEFRQMRGKENEDNEFRKQVVQREFNVVVQLKRYSDVTMPYENN